MQTSTTIENSFVIYSTSKGSTAGDGSAGKGGPFMGIFAEEMMVPGSIQASNPLLLKQEVDHLCSFPWDSPM